MQSIEDLKQALRQGVVSITFEKSDGSIRQMKATLCESYLPPSDPTGSGAKPKSTQVQPVWDVDAAAWRSFRIDRVRSWALL